MRAASGSLFAAVAMAVMVGAVVAGLVVLGHPAEERSRRLDRRRVVDVRALAAATDLYWTRHARLPASTDELMAEPGVSISTEDPERSELYGYQVLDSIRYEVCATFDMASEESSEDSAGGLWVHGSGRQCFELQADAVTADDRRDR